MLAYGPQRGGFAAKWWAKIDDLTVDLFGLFIDKGHVRIVGDVVRDVNGISLACTQNFLTRTRPLSPLGSG